MEPDLNDRVFVWKSSDAKKVRVLHARGHARLGEGFAACGKKLDPKPYQEVRRAFPKCEQCFVQRATGALGPKPRAAEAPRPKRKEWPGRLIEASRHVRRQLEKFAVQFPDFAQWAGQQSRYLKAGLDEIGAAE